MRNILKISVEGKKAELVKPAPPTYYWDAGQNPDDFTPSQKAFHNLSWVGNTVYGGIEFTGEVLVKFLGLDQSRYQWAINELERERERVEELRALKEEREAVERELQLNNESKVVDNLEGGNCEGSSNNI